MYVLLYIYVRRIEYFKDDEILILEIRLGFLYLFLFEFLWKFYRKVEVKNKRCCMEFGLYYFEGL